MLVLDFVLHSSEQSIKASKALFFFFSESIKASKFTWQITCCELFVVFVVLLISKIFLVFKKCFWEFEDF